MNFSATVADEGTQGMQVRRAVGGIVCAVFMPHAPILVPEVGGRRGELAAASQQAMQTAAEVVMRHHPETLVLVSPHAPRQQVAFGIWADNPLHGSFAAFGVPQPVFRLPCDAALAEGIALEVQARHLRTWPIHRVGLDHGALVPLYFLIRAGWSGPTVVLSLNYYPETKELVGLGEAIAAAAAHSHQRIAFIASGDMSHRLTADAPCGFHPQAHRFDETFIRHLRAGQYQQLETLAAHLREDAAEDAVDSALIAAAAIGWQNTRHRVLNYEGPFGVGYGVAVLYEADEAQPKVFPGEAEGAKEAGAILPGLARQSVLAMLQGSSEKAPPPDNDYLRQRAGVFVTIHRTDGSLRGCIGTIDPSSSHIISETWRNARLAAFQDRRFEPVMEDELTALRFAVSVLHPPEKVQVLTELNPARYGLIVSTKDGRRGLLLPGIAEITTPAEQLKLARQKGGIDPSEPVTLQRFEVDHFAEST